MVDPWEMIQLVNAMNSKLFEWARHIQCQKYFLLLINDKTLVKMPVGEINIFCVVDIELMQCSIA